MSQIIVKYDIYQSSKCVIATGSQPAASVTYLIKKKNPILSTYYFKPFEWKKEGCIYDSVKYEFEGLFPNTLPGFITQDQGNISFSIQTNILAFIGVYDI
jgi:hypothetical protein